jgi:threonine/homoserine/homoserine lactone efflux protein
MSHGVLPFIGVAVLIVITPGVDMALVTKNAFSRGRAAAFATALGVNAGIVVWTFASALGVAAVVRASAAAFAVLKLAGAAYLVWLGVQALWRARRAGGVPSDEGRSATFERHVWAYFRQGLVSNLLNPKIAVFFTSLLPQFVAPGRSALAMSLALGGLFNALGVIWLSGYALFAARAGSLLQRPSVRARLERLTGFVLIGLGIRLALERRR